MDPGMDDIHLVSDLLGVRPAHQLGVWPIDLLICWVSDLLTCWVSDLLTRWVSDLLTRWVSDLLTRWVSNLLTCWVSDLLTCWVSDLLTRWVSDPLLLPLQGTLVDRPTGATGVTGSAAHAVPLGSPGYRAPPAQPAPTVTASPHSASWPWWRPRCRPRTPERRAPLRCRGPRPWQGQEESLRDLKWGRSVRRVSHGLWPRVGSLFGSGGWVIWKSSVGNSAQYQRVSQNIC